MTQLGSYSPDKKRLLKLNSAYSSDIPNSHIKIDEEIDESSSENSKLYFYKIC